MRSATPLLATSLMILALAAAPAERTSRSFAVPDHGQLALSFPKTWEATLQQGPPGLKLPPTIQLEATDGQQFLVQITPIPSRDGKAVSLEGLRSMAEVRGRHDLQSARETKIDFQEFKGESARGYYYSLTDKNPNPGEFKYMTAAIVGVGDLILNVTILDNDPAKPQRGEALEMLKLARQVGAATRPAATRPSGELRIAAPGGKWELVLKGAGFEDVEEKGDARAKMATTATDDGWVLSIFFEPAEKAGDAIVVRSFYEERLKRSPLDRTELKLGGDGRKSTSEYTIKSLGQKHINVYMAHQGVWVDVHLSKTEFVPGDRKTLDELVSSIRIEPPVAKK